jgi:hypothetical protein
MCRLLTMVLVVMSVSLGACERPRPVAEKKPEPGLFSGKKGEITIYKSKSRTR